MDNLLDSTPGSCRWIISFVLLLVFGASLPSHAAETDPWQSGEHRDFTPDAGRTGSDPGMAIRGSGPALKLVRTLVYRPRVNPGDVAALRAQYTVVAPTGLVDVKETRIIQFDDVVLVTLSRVVSRSPGAVGSEYQLKVPMTAAEGWYTVTTIIEQVRPATRSSTSDTATTAFYVETAPASAPVPSASDTPNTEDAGLNIRLWASKSRYKIGEPVTLTFETNKDAFVTLVDVGTSGAISILFPNRFSGGNSVRGQKPYSVPGADDGYTLTLNGPPGTELIYALVTLKPVGFVAQDFARTSQTFESVTRSVPIFTRNINAVAKETPLKAQAKAVLELEVVP